MTIQTISELNAEELVKLQFAKRLKVGNREDLEDDTKYAVVLIKLNPSVSVPDDYATLRTNIEAVTGIQGISLLVDHQTKAIIPDNHTQVLRIRADITLRDDTPEE